MAFESSLRRANPKTNSKTATTPSSSSSSKRTTTTAPPPRRSRSVSAFSRTSHSDFSHFSIKRNNPLFDNNQTDDEENEPVFPNSIASKTKPKAVAAAAGTENYNNNYRRGRSISRNAPDGNHVSASSAKNKDKELSRSLSVAADARRRGRCVSQTPLSRTHFSTSESEVEQEGNLRMKTRTKGNLSTTSANGQKSNSVRSRHKSNGSLDSSPTSLTHLKTAKWSDAASTSSFSEVELLETIRRSNSTTDLTDFSPDLVNPSAVELVSDRQQEYATKLEQSKVRARQLRADLAVEEHRGLELSRILKEGLSEANTPSTKKSRPGRKSSIERRKISKCLTEDALAYFDECVSLSTFDGSDFSSLEDPPIKLVGVGTLDGDGILLQHENSSIPPSNFSNNFFHDKQECQFTYKHDSLDLTGSKGSVEQSQDDFSLNSTGREWSQKLQFSFSQKPGQVCELQQDIKKYVKGFGKDVGKVKIDSRITTRNLYDSEEYSLQDSQQSLLFDHVFLKNRLESGSLLLCHGGCSATSFLPLLL